MSTVPTAEEFLQGSLLSHFYDEKTERMVCFDDEVKTAMIEFARLHVKAALEAASKNAKCCDDAIVDLGHTIVDAYVKPDSILNAYPEDKIK